MRVRALFILIALPLLLIACAPPTPAPTPTAAPTIRPTPAPTFTPDPLSTNAWGSLAVADPGFSLRFPLGWSAASAEMDANAEMQGMDLDGPEGRIELRWGADGVGGACASYSALTVADGQLRACHTVADDGTQRWEQIYKELKTATFSARAETKNANEESADLVRRILATLAFDGAALPPVASAPEPAVAAGEIIVDNAQFALTGDWHFFDGGQAYGADCLLALPGLDATAVAKPNLPAAGAYEVFGWWCGNPNVDQTRRGPLTIARSASDTAPHELTVNYAEGAGAWVSLGVYNLRPGATVTQRSAVDGAVPADAFRFVPMASPAASGAAATPGAPATSGAPAVEVPATPQPTGPLVSNHPPSPLEQVTSGDLAARLALNDPFYTSITMTPTDMVFDDCADFPRGQCDGARKGWEAVVAHQSITLTYRVSDDYNLIALAGASALDPWTMGQEHPQRVFLTGGAGGGFAVHYRPDNTWHLLRYGTDAIPPSHTRLTPEQGATIRGLAAKYGTISVNEGNTGATLYGLGRLVAPNEEDRAALLALLDELTP